MTSAKAEHLSQAQHINVLIGCTGSVATIKLPTLLKQLINVYEQSSVVTINIRVVATNHARHFFKREELPASVELYIDDTEWTSWQQRGDPVVHIELAKWADFMVIAPLDANTLSKMSLGICDNLLTCIARAWVFPKPLIFCPAMNTKMWEHPITAQQITTLKEWTFIEVPCIVKNLVCGDVGNGAMAEVGTIIKQIEKTIDKVLEEASNNK